MYILPKKCLYAFEAVVYIAGNSSDRAVSLKEVCEYAGVKVRYLEQVMQQLVHSGILRGVRGPKGGYVLAREKRKLSLKEIFEILDSYSDDLLGDGITSEIGKKIIGPVAERIKDKVREELSIITLEDLCSQLPKNKEAKATAKASDFTI